MATPLNNPSTPSHRLSVDCLLLADFNSAELDNIHVVIKLWGVTLTGRGHLHHLSNPNSYLCNEIQLDLFQFLLVTLHNIEKRAVMISYPGWCQRYWHSWWTWSFDGRLLVEDLPASRGALCCPTAHQNRISYKACWVTKTRCGCPCQKLQMLLPAAYTDAHLGEGGEGFQ